MAEPDRPDAPNQQMVREDGSGPADEGTGGDVAEATVARGAATDAELDAMTKAELVEEADYRGLVFDEHATKAELLRDLRAPQEAPQDA